MNREFLKNAGVPEDQIDTIMAEHGKDIQAEKDKAAKTASDLAEANKTIETYKTQITELEKKAGENTDVKKQLEDLKAQIEKEKKEAEAKKADEQMTAIIREAFPKDKKFVNDYTEQAMISQIKAELGKDGNISHTRRNEYFIKCLVNTFTDDHNIILRCIRKISNSNASRKVDVLDISPGLVLELDCKLKQYPCEFGVITVCNGV